MTETLAATIATLEKTPTPLSEFLASLPGSLGGATLLRPHAALVRQLQARCAELEAENAELAAKLSERATTESGA